MSLITPAANQWVRESGCTGKHRYANPTLAIRVAKRQKGCNAYRCPSCGGWHVGHTPRSKKRPRADHIEEFQL